MDKQELKTHAYEKSPDHKTRRAIRVLVLITALSFLTAVIAGYYSWKNAHEQALAGEEVAEQLRRLCIEDGSVEFENRNLCENADKVVEGGTDVQNREIDDPDPNDPDPNDPDPIDDLDPDSPEKQQPEPDDAEIQDADPDDADPNDPDPNDPDPVDDPDPNDPDPDDPDPNDPDPDDPDPSQPGSWNCPDGQSVVGFTRTEDGGFVLNCAPMNPGPQNPQDP